MARVFITGASGYIGGQVLYALRHSHPDLQITALVRTEDQATTITRALPGVQTALGNLEDDHLIEKQAANADIIIHLASSKHIQSVQTIARALEKRNTPVHWIQISGASVVSLPDIQANVYGEASAKVYDDIDDLGDIKDLIHKNSSIRVVDNFILGLRNANVKTALVFPPIIYGVGQGPINQRSVQIPELSRVAIQTEQVVQVGRGESRWSNVHISDMGQLVVKLVEKALKNDADEQLWNQNGVYFPENGIRTFGEISQIVATAAVSRGFIQNDMVKSVSHGEADNLTGHGGVLWGTNAVLKGQRARKCLGWTPTGEKLEETILRTVDLESKKLSGKI